MPSVRKYTNRYVRAFLEMDCPVLYVKLPSYVRMWYAAEYGVPVVLEECHPARPIIEMSVHTTERVEYDPCNTHNRSVMCDFVWQRAILTDGFDQKEWLALALPDKVVRSDGEVEIDDTWDLYYSDVKRVKDALNDWFWNAVFGYILSKKMDCDKDGVEFQLDRTLQMFCSENGMSTDFYEPLRRQYFRKLEDRRKERQEAKNASLERRDKNLNKIGEGVRFQMLKFMKKEEMSG